MSTERERIDEEVSKTLNSLKDFEHLEAGPYFYTRVQAMLNAAPESRGLLRWLPAGRLAPALVAVVVVLNVITAVVALRSGHVTHAVARDMDVQALAEQYMLTGSPTSIDILAK